MEIVRCKRCNRALKSEESIKVGYGRKCFKIIKLYENMHERDSPNNDIIIGLVDRVRKLELDNTFMKHQLKHKTIVSTSKDALLDWDIPKEIKEVIEHYQTKFNDVVKELKVYFHEGFDYHEVLKPIEVRETPETPPQVIELLN